MARKKRLLLADDDPSICKIVQMALQGMNVELITANDGAEAFQKAVAERPDAILLDIVMPEMDGLEVASKLKSTKTTVDIPMGFLSAQTDNESHRRAQELGAVIFIPKPFKPEKLRVFVQVLLSAKKKAGQPDRATVASRVARLAFRRAAKATGQPTPEAQRKEFQPIPETVAAGLGLIAVGQGLVHLIAAFIVFSLFVEGGPTIEEGLGKLFVGAAATGFVPGAVFTSTIAFGIWRNDRQSAQLFCRWFVLCPVVDALGLLLIFFVGGTFIKLVVVVLFLVAVYLRFYQRQAAQGLLGRA